jgi:putative transposase
MALARLRPAYTLTMYDYRKLSHEMQKRLLYERRQSGLPLHEIPHRANEGNLYLFTAANYEHRPVLNSPERRDSFSTELIETLSEIPEIELFAWCVLPNHYHLLARVEQEKFAAKIARLHNRTSTRWNREDGTAGRKVWFRHCDRDIRSERHFWVTLNYIHANPVKHGYVRRAYEWPWSSVHFYEEKWGRAALRELWREYPVRSYGNKWDF